MKYRSSQHSIYVYRIATLVTLILLVAAGGGLGLLWLRQETSAAAGRIRAAEIRLAETNRRLQFVNVKIAEATTPETLKRRATDLGLGLVAPRQEQVVHMRTAVRPYEEAPTAVAAADQEPLFVTFELALIRGPSPAN